MNVAKRIVHIFAIIAIMLVSIIPFSSFSETGLCCPVEIVEGINVADVNESVELETISEPTSEQPFCAFDVNAAGEYLVGIDRYEKDVVLAFDSNSEYLFGFSFRNSGSFGVMWEDGNVALYPSRNDLEIVVDRNAEILSVDMIQRSVEGDKYRTEVIHANRREVDGICYKAVNGVIDHDLLHWGTYRRLVKTVPGQDDVTIYGADDSKWSYGWIVAPICGVLTMAVICLVFVRKRTGDG